VPSAVHRASRRRGRLESSRCMTPPRHCRGRSFDHAKCAVRGAGCTVGGVTVRRRRSHSCAVTSSATHSRMDGERPEAEEPRRKAGISGYRPVALSLASMLFCALAEQPICPMRRWHDLGQLRPAPASLRRNMCGGTTMGRV
jgi:hypothetical protein